MLLAYANNVGIVACNNERTGVMHPYRLHVRFSGVDLGDDAVFDALSQLDYIDWLESHGVITAVATLDVESAMDAAIRLVTDVIACVPTASPLHIDSDLVSVADIAERVGMTREAVRNWAAGRRRAADFPAPASVVGAANKPTLVWEWAPVSEWLERTLGLGDPYRFPTRLEAAAINIHLMTWSPPLPSVDAPWQPAELSGKADLLFGPDRIELFYDNSEELRRVLAPHEHHARGVWTITDEEKSRHDVSRRSVHA